MLTMARSRDGWQDVDRLHLRVYGPEDYLQRLRARIADGTGFSSIPEPASVPAVNGVELDLKARMERVGITQAELAEHLGKKRCYISALLNGIRPWPKSDLRERCQAFLADREQG